MKIKRFNFDFLRYLGIIFFLGLGFMAFQISILRELRFQVSTIFILGPLLFSAVLTFIGFGSLLVGFMDWSTKRVLRWGLIILPLLMLLSLIAVVILAHHVIIPINPEAYFEKSIVVNTNPSDLMHNILNTFIILIPVCCGVVFLLQGGIFASLYAQGRKDGTLHGLYAFDMFSGGLGAVIAGTIAIWITPFQQILLAGVSVVIAFIISRPILGYSKRQLILILLIQIVVLTTALTLSNSYNQLEVPPYLRPYVLYSVWTPYQRIDLVKLPNRISVFVDGYRFYDVWEPDNLKNISYNAIMLSLLENAEKSNKGLEPIRTALLIGTGAGQDVLALNEARNPPHMVAVELDPGVIESAKKIPWIWEGYQKADIKILEGRYFLETTKDQFDMIYYASIDPRAPISNLAFPEANFLYTAEAFRVAYSRLTPDGLLVIRRIFPVNQFDQAIDMHRRTLQEAGITPDKILIFRENSSFNIPTLENYGILNVYIFVGKKSFSPIAKDTIRQIMDTNMQAVELSAEPKEQGKVAHDTYPFSIPSWNIGDSIVGFFLWVQTSYPWMIFVVIVLVLILLLKVGINLAIGHFFLLGLSWMIVESIVLFYSFLILGNPALSTGVALGAFLCSNGVGSYISKYLQRRRKILILLPLLIILYTLMIPVLIPFLLGQSLYLRSMIFFMSVAMVGVLTGTMFPISLRTFKKDSVPRLFFIDLIGGGLAPLLFWLIFFIWGLNAISAIAVVGYALTIIVLNRVKS
jgi:predicted membrane-bound spermidine synthase